ncbi:hypothetical protein [Bacillus sp. T33-2]|uniref:hypothetical protein n=1 Tax=Bacillus sp. T33-2 TaxID=2054168 RepID=UPI000C7786F8|nr:hypothetical protein [Bacillus sp. T33-2]PLR96886.1 hypothetical protein CVD19_09855 [Bacillus sp. T33-2]
MVVVHFIENKNVLLSQFRNQAPAVGDELRIKGRKAKVSAVNLIEENVFHVHLVLETVSKKKQTIADLSKKKKR